MRVLIAAHAVRMGGALQHLRGLLPALAAGAPDHEWLVLGGQEAARALAPLPPRVRWQLQDTERLDPARRFLAERAAILAAACAFEPDAVLSLNGYAVLGAGWPQVLVAANALYLSPEYWRQVARQGLLARADALLRAALLRLSLRWAAAIVVPSGWMARELARRWGLSSERARVVHHGVDETYFAIGASRGLSPAGANAPLTVLAVSKHGINKDFATLVRAAALVRGGEGLDFRVELAGGADESPFAERTSKLIGQLGLAGTVRFVGEESAQDLAPRYGRADLFVFPSWCESFGLPQVEAAAAGLPVIAPDLEVSRELLGDAARYYTPLNPTSLAGQMRALLRDPDERARLGALAAQRARAFTWQRAARGTLEVLESVARCRRSLAP